MSNTETAAKPKREITKALAPATFLPKRLLGKSEDVRELTLGTLLGLAEDLKKGSRTDSMTGEVTDYIGFTGQFEFVDTIDPARPTQIAGVMYMPGGFETLLTDAVLAAKANGGKVGVAFSVGVIRAKNAAGYSWKLEPLFEPAETDPLAEMRASLGLAKPPAIENKAEAPKETAKSK